MLLTGTIEDIFDEDGYLKFKVEDSSEIIELPIEIFEGNIEVDSRYRISLTQIPLYERIRDSEN